MIVELIRTVWGNDQVRDLALLLVGVLLSGVAAAVRRKEFTFTRLWDWLCTYVVPALLAYAAAAVIAIARPELEAFRVLAYYTIGAALLAFSLKNVCQILRIEPPAVLGGRR